jgi:hypothetical protein
MLCGYKEAGGLSMAENDEVPTLKEAIEQWLGVQLPAIPLPQTVRNLDKAIAKVVSLRVKISKNESARIPKKRVREEGLRSRVCIERKKKSGS